VTANQGGTWTVGASQSGAWTVAASQSGSWTVGASQSGAWSLTSNQGIPNSSANAWPFYCTSGCSGASAFSDNSAFTAGSTGINITGGWYSTSPTNCTSGNACAPNLTVDRKLWIDAFQGTSPWVISGTTTATQTTGSNLHTVVDSGNIQLNGNSTVFSGQQAVTASAVALASNAAKGVCIRAIISSVVPVYIGPSGVTTSTGTQLNPGESLCLPVTNTNLLYVIATTTGSTISFIGSN
jgi:hypothetical protein